ncbi:MAG: ATP-dependent DNA helicase RecG [Planctomycetota bacterium]|nr:MAG: ATP-dependent DNA helicase RecG [Planctomycetota bacterium]
MSRPVTDHSTDRLATPLVTVPGIGPRRAALLQRIGLETVRDVLWQIPRDVIDLTNVTPVRKLKVDERQTVRGVVVDIDARPLSGNRSLTAILVDCGDGAVRATWFNQPWVVKRFRVGDLVLLSGRFRRWRNQWEVNQPLVQWLTDDEVDSAAAGAYCRYPLTEGLSQGEMRRIVRECLQFGLGSVADPLPRSFRQRLHVPPLRQAIHDVHLPPSPTAFEAARRRLLLDDLLEFSLGVLLRRRAWKSVSNVPRIEITPKVDARIRALFPFALTDDQNRAVREIAQDLASGRAMHRLLQADVGAGKTVVALYAMLATIAAGYQTALMAPTELLAAQHWQVVEEWLAHSRVQRILLTGQLTNRERTCALDQIREGQIQLVVGTQAVIQRDVRFARLGLVVIDEQHKFGVMQRAWFSSDRMCPHMLVMTATPIPRSLCLTQFGDLDVTVIRQLPPGRRPVATYRVDSAERRRRAWQFVRERLKEGRQAYVVCPRVGGEAFAGTANAGVPASGGLFAPAADIADPAAGSAQSPPDPEPTVRDEQDDASAVGGIGAVEAARELQAGELRGFRVGLAHGRMPREEKLRAMELFRQGELDVLVCTTVVEVGVDVPNATLMIVLDADRFGLSQLHQLRGRVGRGRFQGYCLLFSESRTEDAVARLEALEKHADGFTIAEVDFELRGPGDVLGTRQHGRLPLRAARLPRDQKMLFEAYRVAEELVESGRIDTPEFAALKTCVLERFGDVTAPLKTG